MTSLYPIAKADNRVLIINESDLAFVGKERAMEVMCVKVDVQRKKISELLELENCLKFDAWEETNQEQRESILKTLATAFSNEEIMEKITNPLKEKILR